MATTIKIACAIIVFVVLTLVLRHGHAGSAPVAIAGICQSHVQKIEEMRNHSSVDEVMSDFDQWIAKNEVSSFPFPDYPLLVAAMIKLSDHEGWQQQAFDVCVRAFFKEQHET